MEADIAAIHSSGLSPMVVAGVFRRECINQMVDELGWRRVGRGDTTRNLKTREPTGFVIDCCNHLSDRVWLQEMVNHITTILWCRVILVLPDHMPYPPLKEFTVFHLDA